VIEADPFCISRNDELAALTVRHAVPAISQFREFAAAGVLLEVPPPALIHLGPSLDL
jgi:hypothetical protein